MDSASNLLKNSIEEILNWGLLVDHFLMASEFYYLGKDGHCTVEDAWMRLVFLEGTRTG